MYFHCTTVARKRLNVTYVRTLAVVFKIRYACILQLCDCFDTQTLALIIFMHSDLSRDFPHSQIFGGKREHSVIFAAFEGRLLRDINMFYSVALK
jgi:hypothetical protein